MPETSPDFVSIILKMLGGLSLFLYGVTLMGEKLKELAADNMKKILKRFTKNAFSGIVTGTVATAILDSSSVVIIMILSMVNAGIISSIEAYGVVMGANIGTTVSSQLIALDVMEYSPIILAVGLIILMAAKKEVAKKAGHLIFASGLVFFGLFFMDSAVEPLKDYAPVTDWLKGLDHPIKGALMGALLTLVIQSSSATVGIAIVLASQGLVSLPAGIAIMLGAEIGTCSDTLLAVIGRSREAIRTGLFHLLFNIVTVCIGLILIQRLFLLVNWISGGASAGTKLANAHMIFNISGVILLAWFIPQFHILMIKLVPDKKKKMPVSKLTNPKISSP